VEGWAEGTWERERNILIDLTTIWCMNYVPDVARVGTSANKTGRISNACRAVDKVVEQFLIRPGFLAPH
jgi:hypothetical protein